MVYICLCLRENLVFMRNAQIYQRHTDEWHQKISVCDWGEETVVYGGCYCEQASFLVCEIFSINIFYMCRIKLPTNGDSF